MIRFIEDSKERQKISREILENLTDWFEVKESREDYIKKSSEWPFWAATENDKLTGFLCLKETGKETVEIAVMGVKKEFHRKGYGRKLFEAAKEYAFNHGYFFIQVKTVCSGMYADYDKTNEFYKNLGFKEFEVIKEIWGEKNPCQIYVMNLKNVLSSIAQRRSYRGKFLNKPVPRKDLEIIANAGINAPSGCNKQTTELIIIDDNKVLDNIKSLIDPLVAQSAPAMIVVLEKRINAYRDKCFATQDYSAAIENMLLAIEELGYKSCWYEGHITDDDRICDEMEKILGVPEDTDLVCYLPVGIGTDPIPDINKKTFNERVCFNGYGSML